MYEKLNYNFMYFQIRLIINRNSSATPLNSLCCAYKQMAYRNKQHTSHAHTIFTCFDPDFKGVCHALLQTDQN